MNKHLHLVLKQLFHIPRHAFWDTVSQISVFATNFHILRGTTFEKVSEMLLEITLAT